MTEEEFIEQEIERGRKLHYNNGEWWAQKNPLFCETAIPYKQLKLGQSSPTFSKALLGYGYYTNDRIKNPWAHSIMGMELYTNLNFDIKDLSSNRRSKVRRGLKRHEIMAVTDLGDHFEEIREVVVSARKRTGAGKSVSFYYDYFKDWKKELNALCRFKDRQFWLAYNEKKLAAYFHTTVVNDLCIINAAKSHSEYLSNYPNDALIYTVLDYAINKRKCKLIEYGDFVEGDKQLNRFKEGYGFKKMDMAMYVHLRLPVRGLLKK